MSSADRFLDLILKGLAMAMAVATVVLGVLGTASVDTLVTLLGIGLFVLAVAALRASERAPVGRSG